MDQHLTSKYLKQRQSIPWQTQVSIWNTQTTQQPASHLRCKISSYLIETHPKEFDLTRFALSFWRHHAGKCINNQQALTIISLYPIYPSILLCWCPLSFFLSVFLSQCVSQLIAKLFSLYVCHVTGLDFNTS